MEFRKLNVSAIHIHFALLIVITLMMFSPTEVPERIMVTFDLR